MKALKNQTRRFLSRFNDDVNAWTVWDVLALVGLGWLAADVFQLIEIFFRWISS